MIMAKEAFGPEIARAVFPGIQGGPHDNTTLAKAVAFGEALSPLFSTYVRQIIDNARVMAKEFMDNGIRVISGGTDNHIILLDIFGSLNISGKEAEIVLESIGVSCNKNMIPFDTRKPLDPSGIRLGTPAITTRGFDVDASKKLATIVIQALKNHTDTALHANLKEQVKELCIYYPIP
jgi:glycine hydroxymethyltransferase